MTRIYGRAIDVIIMDNMRSHHVKSVKEPGIDFAVFTALQSGDFNPIEKMWSKIKAVLRKLRVRILSELPYAIELSLSKIARSDCIGWCSYVGIR